MCISNDRIVDLKESIRLLKSDIKTLTIRIEIILADIISKRFSQARDHITSLQLKRNKKKGISSSSSSRLITGSGSSGYSGYRGSAADADGYGSDADYGI
jgi:hypothetical protein